MTVLVSDREMPEKCVSCVMCRRCRYNGMNLYYCELSYLSVDLFDANESVRCKKISANCTESKAR